MEKKIKRFYNEQDGCNNCYHVFVRTEYDEGEDYYCNIQKDRPKCGSVHMGESFFLNKTSDKEWMKLDKTWDKWAKKFEVKPWGKCQHWVDKNSSFAPKVITKGPLKGKTIVCAPQSNVNKYKSEIAFILKALGHPEALVTDESRVFDFFSFGLKPASQKAALTRLRKKLGIDEIEEGAFLWKLAAALRFKGVVKCYADGKDIVE